MLPTVHVPGSYAGSLIWKLSFCFLQDFLSCLDDNDKVVSSSNLVYLLLVVFMRLLIYRH